MLSITLSLLEDNRQNQTFYTKYQLSKNHECFQGYLGHPYPRNLVNINITKNFAVWSQQQKNQTFIPIFSIPAKA